MSCKEISHNITIQSFDHKVDKKLAILLTTSYLLFDYPIDMITRPKLDEEMNGQTNKEAEFFKY